MAVCHFPRGAISRAVNPQVCHDGANLLASHFPRREPASLPRRRDFFAGTAALSAAKSVQGVAAAMAPPVILPLVFTSSP